jgi:ADP-heptose:LPS heptosyltransferase
MLVLRPGAIGDTLLAAPALSALRGRYPEHHLHVVGNQHALPVLAAMGLADDWTPFDDPSVTRLFVDREPVSDDPFAPLDVAVAWCADEDGVLQRSLRRRGARDLVIARSRPPAGSRIYVARHLMRMLAPLGIDQDAPLVVPPIVLPTDVRAAATADLSRAGLEVGRYLVVHPGSGSPAKNWPADRFADIVERLRDAHGIPALLLAGPADGEVVERLQGRLTRPVPVLADRALLALAEIVRAARAYLGNDSGLSHLAGMVGTPTLVLFGPTEPALWTPLGERIRVLRQQPLDALPADAVLRELAQLL